MDHWSVEIRILASEIHFSMFEIPDLTVETKISASEKKIPMF